MVKAKRLRCGTFVVLLIPSVLCLAGGCVKTVDSVTFLSLYVYQAVPGQSEMGWYAYPAGHDERYQYMDVEWSDWGRLFSVRKGFRKEKYRCPVADIPADFPEGLSRDLQSVGWYGPRAIELRFNSKVGDKIIREYLDRHGKLSDEAKAALEPRDES